AIIVPNGTMGQRWEKDAKWNLILENEDGTRIEPALSVEQHGAEWETISFPYFDNNGNGTFERPIPAKKVKFEDGSEHLVTSVYDLMLSQYGVNRIGSDLEATGYDDETSFYTPAWQEKITNVKPELVTQIAVE